MQIIKPILYTGQALEGVWDFTLKVDGVRVLLTSEGVFSRNGKSLPGLKHYHKEGFRGDYEFYTGTFSQSISLARSHLTKELYRSYLYRLNPIDERLKLFRILDPEPERVENVLGEAIKHGYEGLVLRRGDVWYKVKKQETYDVKVIGMIPGNGQFLDKLGALITERGNVGTGFTNRQREEFYLEDLIGETIEVRCMELTKTGLFRHPSFIRVRYDK